MQPCWIMGYMECSLVIGQNLSALQSPVQVQSPNFFLWTPKYAQSRTTTNDLQKSVPSIAGGIKLQWCCHLVTETH